jgi:hypothetical protein
VARLNSISTPVDPQSGTPILQTIVGDPLAISPEGKVVARFGREKIYDVQQPFPVYAFVADNDAYVLVRGQKPLGQQTKWRTPAGEVVEGHAVEVRYFVAHFKEDGSYDRSVPLDLPFHPVQLGVFGDGSFLIAGADRAGNPEIVIVASDGQVRKWIELKGDVHARTEADSAQDKTALPTFARNFGESLMGAVGGSQIIGNGSDLLLFRPGGSSVFSISLSGEVKTTTLKIPGQFQIYVVKPLPDKWIVELQRNDREAHRVVFETYAFHPATGEPLVQYLFPSDYGFGLACAEGSELTFVMADPQGEGLNLVKLAPTGK